MALASPGPVQADAVTLLDFPAGPRSIGPGNALPATRQELINAGLDRSAIFENWGMPWNATIRTAAWLTASAAGRCILAVGLRVISLQKWRPLRRMH